jgi:hypothetical protein
MMETSRDDAASFLAFPVCGCGFSCSSNRSKAFQARPGWPAGHLAPHVQSAVGELSMHPSLGRLVNVLAVRAWLSSVEMHQFARFA